jgi:hypothetical protein
MKETINSKARRMRGAAQKSEMVRRLRLANLRKLLRDRNGPILPDDDAGREYLIELLLPISVGPHAAIKMANTIEVWAPWMNKKQAGAIIDQISLMPLYQRKPTAKVLGERLRLTNPDRERLKLWTIAPCDMGRKGTDWWRKQKKRKRMRRLRQLRGAKAQATSISRTKPWILQGISRASWYRLRETTSCQVKLINKTEHESVSPHQVEPPQEAKPEKESTEKEPTISNAKTMFQAQKTEETVTDTALELLARTCLTTVADQIGGQISSNTWDDWDGLLPDKETIDAYLAAWNTPYIDGRTQRTPP